MIVAKSHGLMLLHLRQQTPDSSTLSAFNISRISVEEIAMMNLRKKNDITTTQKILKAYKQEKSSTLILQHMLQKSQYADIGLLGVLLSKLKDEAGLHLLTSLL